MSDVTLDKCKSYLDAQAGRVERGLLHIELPVVTISREAMAGASDIAQLVAERLNQHTHGTAPCPWTVFDRNLVERVLEDHELPKTLDRFMSEDASVFSPGRAVEEILGLHPSDWTLVQHTTETILRLARLGNVILIGRGSNIITRRLKKAVHIRLVAPEPVRIQRAAEAYKITTKEATALIHERDAARHRYVKHNFHVAIDDPLQYHAVLNTGLIDFDLAARLIADAVTLQFPH
jgi:cytidylate kinase